MAKTPVARTFERDAEGDGYCYSRPPDDGEGPSAPVLAGAPDDNDIVLNWSPAIDALGGILDYQVERSAVSPESFSLLATKDSDVTTHTDTDVGNSVSWKYRVRARDTAPTPNAGSYSNIVTVTTPSSAEQLQPGTLAIEDASYSAAEGGQITFRVRRSGNGSASPTVTVNYAFTGLGSGAPNPSTGTLTWTSTTSGLQAATVSLGSVTTTTVGAVTLSNPQATTGSIQPTLGLSSVPVTVSDIPTAGYTHASVTGNFTNNGSIIISGAGFGANGPTTRLYATWSTGASGTNVQIADPETGSLLQAVNSPYYSTVAARDGSVSVCCHDGDAPGIRILRGTFPQSTRVKVRYWVYYPIGSSFPGGSIGSYSPAGSNYKLSWLGISATMSGGTDVCIPSFSGGTECRIDGNGNTAVEGSGCTWSPRYPNSSGTIQSHFRYGEWCMVECLQDADNEILRINHWTPTIAQWQRFAKSAPNYWGNSGSQYWSHYNLPGYIRAEPPSPNAFIYHADECVATGTGAWADVFFVRFASNTLKDLNDVLDIRHAEPTSWSNTSITATPRGISTVDLRGYSIVIRTDADTYIVLDGEIS